MRKVIRKPLSGLPNMQHEISDASVPQIGAEDYKKRMQALWEKASDYYTHLIVYADREHFSNMEYLTGYDPRFEEALLILSPKSKTVIVVGNEGCAYASKVPFPVDIVIYPTFSLPGQPRNPGLQLENILRDAGLNKSSRVGVLGWKCFDKNDFLDYAHQYDLPYFIMQAIINVTGMDCLTNANELMVGNTGGLRHDLCAKEMVLCEFSGTKSSRNTYRVLRNLREGMSELEASACLQIDGDPLSTHPNINFGENVFWGLSSPTPHRKLLFGDIVSVGMAYRRSLCHKVSHYVKGPKDISQEAEEIYDKYFAALTIWYEALGEGVSGGEVYDSVLDAVGNYRDFGISLNPGHLIHTEEWTNSLFYQNSPHLLQSGMAVQCDFTAAFPEKKLSVHAEDGIVIANAALQREIEAISPDSYARMKARQAFMQDFLGIRLAPEILPTSDMPGVLFPYLVNMEAVLANGE